MLYPTRHHRTVFRTRFTIEDVHTVDNCRPVMNADVSLLRDGCLVGRGRRAKDSGAKLAVANIRVRIRRFTVGLLRV